MAPNLKGPPRGGKRASVRDSTPDDLLPGSVRHNLGRMLQRLFSIGNSQTGRTVISAGAWSAFGYGATTVLRFISRVVLAKFLSDASPMGDVAIIVVILAGLEMISDLGIGFGIVQHRKGQDRTFLGTAFSVQALRGVGIWLIASALAQPIAWLYRDQDLMGLMLFGALSTLFKAFSNPGIWLFTRGMDLRRPTFLTIGTEVLGFIVTIVWVIVSPSAWAIVGGTVAAAAAYAAGSYVIANRIRFAWDPEMARDIIQFGGWMLISSGTSFLSSRGETLMLRGAISEVEFGCFAFAIMLVTTPVVGITQLAVQVYFPMLSASMREDRGRAERQFKLAKWAFTATALCFVYGGIFVGPLIVDLMNLPATFDGLTWMVPLLAVRASLDILVAPTGGLLFAAGASRYSAWANVIRLIVLVGGLFAIVPEWGLRGAMWILIGAPAISYLALLPGVHRQMPGALKVDLTNLGVFWLGTAAALIIHFSI
jgi:O-antigen/teichoic acid export membrane protein